MAALDSCERGASISSIHIAAERNAISGVIEAGCDLRGVKAEVF